jgi:hypothetical protein
MPVNETSGKSKEGRVKDPVINKERVRNERVDLENRTSFECDIA